MGQKSICMAPIDRSQFIFSEYAIFIFMKFQIFIIIYNSSEDFPKKKMKKEVFLALKRQKSLFFLIFFKLDVLESYQSRITKKVTVIYSRIYIFQICQSFFYDISNFFII